MLARKDFIRTMYDLRPDFGASKKAQTYFAPKVAAEYSCPTDYVTSPPVVLSTSVI